MNLALPLCSSQMWLWQTFLQSIAAIVRALLPELQLKCQRAASKHPETFSLHQTSKHLPRHAAMAAHSASPHPATPGCSPVGQPHLTGGQAAACCINSPASIITAMPLLLLLLTQLQLLVWCAACLWCCCCASLIRQQAQ
jgi:hypothetical protein